MAVVYLIAAKHLPTIARDVSLTNSPLYLVTDKDGSDVLLTDDLPKALASDVLSEGGKIRAYEKGVAGESYRGVGLRALREIAKSPAT